jgi:hypothetical protein
VEKNIKMKTYFISGHGSTTFEEWFLSYKPLIDNALKLDSSFILSDFRGTDILTMEYLKNKTPKVIITHCFENPQYQVDIVGLLSKNWTYIGNFQSEVERDIFMTENSDEDIAWVREGREKSGTAKNIKRRLAFQKLNIEKPE